MRSLWNMTLGAFRDDIESRSMPGCGAAAASSAANGLALVLKGLRLSADDETAASRDRLIEQADVCVDALAGYADEDVAAFQDYLAARKAASDPDRDSAVAEAGQRITQVPVDTARACLEGLALSRQAMAYTKPALQSDTRAGAQLLHAGLSMVLLNVDANTAQLDDPQASDALRQERQRLQADADRYLAALTA
ncbi:cyclodeaminase/cyclohydrolase family protein [Salinisphaera sp. SPP-AMP-43]|uniref:cyclodeaminase/cyclohydrolase family protein n=1 Tax=Salinisphaera sp. SPP-AMP-43 TaxID=3121288 RepID=UPI003C6E8B74